MCVLSVNTLYVTGSTYSFSSFFASVSLISSDVLSGDPSTGLVPCFLIQGRMLVRSKIVPAGVQTGCANGCRESEQKLKGRRLNGA
jgi:hypothetical protein